jgi:uncharacterized Zn-binding protein involved in type VI secretion
MGKPAARITDKVAHPTPPVLTQGPGSPNVLIGGLRAWRGIPKGSAKGIQEKKKVSDKAIKAVETPSKTSALELTIQAEEATNMIKTIIKEIEELAKKLPGTPDIHMCSTPLPPVPHGPGIVINGSSTVMINGLPACRRGDTIVEALGPPNKIVGGCLTVEIGD